MKKILLSAAAVICLSTAAFSQNKGTTKFGIQAGLNLSTVSADNITNSNYRTGFNAGVSADHFFSESWSLKVKALYDQKGWNSGYIAYDDGNGTTMATTDYKLDYVTVPVLANWHFGGTKNWYLNFGPYISFLLNAKETALNTDLKEAFNTVDAGLDLGIGVQFPVSQKARFFIEVNGQGGITDMAKSNQGSALRSTVSSLNIGVNF